VLFQKKTRALPFPQENLFPRRMFTPFPFQGRLLLTWTGVFSRSFPHPPEERNPSQQLYPPVTSLRLDTPPNRKETVSLRCLMTDFLFHGRGRFPFLVGRFPHLTLRFSWTGGASNGVSLRSSASSAFYVALGQPPPLGSNFHNSPLFRWKGGQRRPPPSHGAPRSFQH